MLLLLNRLALIYKELFAFLLCRLRATEERTHLGPETTTGSFLLLLLKLGLFIRWIHVLVFLLLRLVGIRDWFLMRLLRILSHLLRLEDRIGALFFSLILLKLILIVVKVPTTVIILLRLLLLSSVLGCKVPVYFNLLLRLMLGLSLVFCLGRIVEIKRWLLLFLLLLLLGIHLPAIILELQLVLARLLLDDRDVDGLLKDVILNRFGRLLNFIKDVIQIALACGHTIVDNVA